jgi:hypothetical protein
MSPGDQDRCGPNQQGPGAYEGDEHPGRQAAVPELDLNTWGALLDEGLLSAESVAVISDTLASRMTTHQA